MAIDFNKYTMDRKIQETGWKPPISERQMDNRSKKLALSTRCYPEYLLAAQGFLEQRKSAHIDSLSDLIYKIICEFVNQNMEEIGNIPPAEVALDHYIQRGFISANHKENQSKISAIRNKQTLLQEKIDSGSATVQERIQYWENVDPEKAESIKQEAIKEASALLMQDLEKGDKPTKKKSKPETVIEEHTGNIPGAAPEPDISEDEN